MDKSKLDGFIKRYNLNGCVESVKVISSESDDSLTTSFISEEKHVLGTVELKNENFGDVELGILETARLKNMLAVLGNDINIETTEYDGRVISLNLSDKTTKANCLLADISVIPKVPKMKTLPDWDVILPLSKEFMSRFIKAKGALPEVDTFTLVMSKKTQKLELVIGYSSINTNRVSLEVEPQKGNDTVTDAISFSAKYFKEILSANSDATNATLHVSSKGLAFIEFDNSDYATQYFLTGVDISD